MNTVARDEERCNLIGAKAEGSIRILERVKTLSNLCYGWDDWHSLSGKTSDFSGKREGMV